MIILRNNWIMLNGKKVGFIENGTYNTIRNEEKHFYFLGGGYPISTEVLDWLDKHGINNIRIIVKDENLTKSFSATTEQYLKGSLVSHEGFDEQKCVPIEELNMFK